MIICQEEGLYEILDLKLFRKTEGVIFDLVSKEVIEKTASVDRVIHSKKAVSPGKVGDVERPWYMHAFQKDHLLVLHGYRTVELYNQEYGKIVTFEVHPDKIYRDGELIHEGGIMLSWPTHVFHRIVSGPEGSASLNFAVRSEEFNVKTNFNIYDLDTESGKFHCIREGYKDQFGM